MPFDRQAEAAGGGEVQRLGITGDLPDDESEVATAQPFLDREERILGGAGNDMDHAVAQAGGQAGSIRPPAQAQRLVILHPQPAPCLRRSAIQAAQPILRESQGERGSAPLVRSGEDLCMNGIAP